MEHSEKLNTKTESGNSYTPFFQKEKLESSIHCFKFLYYTAITGGLIWHMAYYGSIRLMPDLDIANLVGYLVSIFVSGLFIVLFIGLFFILPGLILYLSTKEKSPDARFLKKSLKKKMKLIPLNSSKKAGTELGRKAKVMPFQNIKTEAGVMIFLMPGIIYICLLIVDWVNFNKFKWSTADSKIYFALLLFIVIVGTVLYPVVFFRGKYVLTLLRKKLSEKILARKKFALLEKRKYNWSICSVILSEIIFLIVIISLMPIFGGEKDIIFGPVTFSTMILLAATMNGFIATDGFNMIPIKHPTIKSISGILLAVLLTVLILSQIKSKENSNPLVTAPFKMLRIGQVDADISLDADYIKKVHLIEKLHLPENSQSSFKFKILSSIGKEYIVQYPIDQKINEKQDEMKDTTKENNPDVPTEKHVLRIPKSEVLMVDYIEEQKKSPSEANKNIQKRPK